MKYAYKRYANVTEDQGRRFFVLCWILGKEWE